MEALDQESGPTLSNVLSVACDHCLHSIALADYYPNIYRFTTSIFPSKEDDVVTSPYNSILSLSKLIAHADCVLPVENQALINVCNTIDKSKGKSPSEKTGEELIGKSDDPVTVKGSKLNEIGTAGKAEKPYDRMNNIIAHLLSNLTWYTLHLCHF